MQSFISSWAIAVTIAVLFSAIISSLLPETSIKKYIAVVLGVVVTIIILSPLFNLLNGADYKQEIDKALNSITTGEYKHDGSSYRDYIFEVYMGNE